MKLTTQHRKEKDIRKKLILWILETGSPLHALFHAKRTPWNLSSDDLVKYQDGSLGKSLGEFYKKEKFEPIAKAERHDVFHVLLGYSTDVIEEAAMQFFLWGNRKPSFFTIGSCLLTALLFPNKISYFISHFQKGKEANTIRNWNFKFLLQEDLQALKQQIFTKNRP